MARSASKARTLLTFNHPIRIEVREPEFTLLDSVRHLDTKALAHAARAEVEVGEVRTECCRHLVRAVLAKGKVTGLRVEPLSKAASAPMTPELTRLLKVVQRKLMARRPAGPKFPMPVKQFLAAAMRISVQTLTCIQICAFGWCIACCWTDKKRVFCGRITIDTTKNPYPEP
jgi:hypothetical protein